MADGLAIPGSYWGESEAGIIGSRIYARADTPLHSLLHEAGHLILMPPERRAGVHTDAADSQYDEDATCYLQILLACGLPGFGSDRAIADMDAWGYSFRLGSAGAWFLHDAEDAWGHLGRLPHLQAELPSLTRYRQMAIASMVSSREPSARVTVEADSQGESKPATMAWNINEMKACIDDALPRCAG